MNIDIERYVEAFGHFLFLNDWMMGDRPDEFLERLERFLCAVACDAYRNGAESVREQLRRPSSC